MAIVATILALTAALLAMEGQLIEALPVFIGVAVIAAVSFWDDVRPLPAAIRFACHSLAAGLVVGSRVWTDGPGILNDSELNLAALWLFCGVSFVVLVGYTNAFNFMDGINGIAASQALVTGFGMAMLGAFVTRDLGHIPTILCLVIAGSAAGFLPHNFPRARMFMGDVGSAPLGFLLATSVVWFASIGGPDLLVPLLLLHANFVFDTSITLVRRLLRGEPWYKPHREHFYQRLVRSGRSHAFVTVLETSIQCLVLALCFAYVVSGIAMRVLIVASVAFAWSLLFAWAEASYCRALQTTS